MHNSVEGMLDFLDQIQLVIILRVLNGFELFKNLYTYHSKLFVFFYKILKIIPFDQFL